MNDEITVLDIFLSCPKEEQEKILKQFQDAFEKDGEEINE